MHLSVLTVLTSILSLILPKTPPQARAGTNHSKAGKVQKVDPQETTCGCSKETHSSLDPKPKENLCGLAALFQIREHDTKLSGALFPRSVRF